MASPALAPAQVADVTLALFGGRKTDIAPSDCPEGITPDEQDGVYLPGNWQNRPGLARLYPANALTAGSSVLYSKTYIQPNNDPLTLVLTSDGQLWVEDVGNAPGTLTALFQIEAGLSAQSVSADGREYIAFSDLLHGQAVPLQYDGTNLDRVTQDGPGKSPTVADYQGTINPIGAVILPTAGFATITSATESGNIVTITTNAPHGYYAGQTVFILGVGVAGYNGLQIVGTTPTAETFTYTVSASGLASSSGGFSTYPIVYLNTGITNPLTPPQINVGDAITLTGTGGAFDNNVNGNPATWPVTQVKFNYGVGENWQILFDFSTAPSTITYTNYTVGGTVLLGGQSAVGVHQVVCMFLTRNGALTQPSPPLQFVSVGNTQWQVTGLPLGPPNVVARVLGFTGAGGDNFFIIPASVTIPNVNSPTGTPIVVKSTIVEDNTSTTAIFDVPDDTLFAGIAIDQIGNDLFDQRVLGPVLGFFAYASRLMCWGDYAKVENLLNMGFCGGYLSGVLTTPLGWTPTANAAGGTLVFSEAPINAATTAAVVATGLQTVALTNYINIARGAVVQIGGATPETVTVVNLSGVYNGTRFVITGIYANFTKTHVAGVSVTGFGPDSVLQTPWAASMAWQITGDGTNNSKGQISQPAYTDAYGAQILLPNTQYEFRCWGRNASGAVTGTVFCDITSPTAGLLARATIPFASFGTAGVFSPIGNFAIASFNAATPAVLPADVEIEFYTQGGNDALQFSELELIYSQNPYNNTLVRVSYVENPEGFAQTTGNLGAADDDSAVQCLALLQESALLETLDGVHLFQDNGNEPGASPGGWQVNQKTRAVGACSLRAGDPGKFGTGDAAEDWAVVAGKNGVYLFAGGEFWKVSQEISRGALPQAQDPRPCWDDINWAAQQSIVAKNDPATRRAYFAVPLAGAVNVGGTWISSPGSLPTQPNVVFVLDYREMDTATQIASAPPVHITIQGKMKSSDLTRKWSVWNISANDLEILVRPANARQLYFAGGARGGAAYGNLYALNPAKLTDDDYGQMYPYYTTYAFTDHDQEQAFQLGADGKLVKHIHAFVVGVGQVTITPIRNSLYNFQPSLSSRILTADTNAGNYQANDVEWSGLNIRGQRIFFRVSVQPLPGATDVQVRLQKFIVGMMKDPVALFRQSGV